MSDDLAVTGVLLFVIGIILGTIRFLWWFVVNLGSMETIAIPAGLILAGVIVFVAAVAMDPMPP
jgi:hypothetical protein